MATQRRLYIGGLFPEVTEHDLKSRFSKFGEVKDVDIHTKYDDSGGIAKVFAYVELIANDSDLANCFKIYSNTRWKGCEITLQIAKENFLQRLKKERDVEDKRLTLDVERQSFLKQHDGSQLDLPSESGSKPNKSPVKRTLPKFQGTKTVLHEPPVTEQLPVVNMDTSSDSEHSGESEVETDDSADTVTLLSKQRTVKMELDSDEPKTRGRIEQQPLASEKLHVPAQENTKKHLVLHSIKEEKPDIATSTCEDRLIKSVDDNEKRLQALKERQAMLRKQKLAVKEALSRKNFSIKKENKMKLFSESEASDAEEPFKVKPQFEGKKGYELMELQASYKGDERFVLDERFLKSMPDAADETKKNDPSFQVVENMFGSLEHSKQKLQKLSFRPLPRYDPTQEGSEKYLVKKEAASSTKKKKKVEREVPPLPEVSQDRYYEVSKSFKDALSAGEIQKTSGFSLLEQFGRADHDPGDKDSDTNGNQDSQTSKVPSFRRINPFQKNPFKFESSDEDEDDQGSKKSLHFMVPPITSNRHVGSETFFFHPNDERFKDALEFYRKDSPEEIERKWQSIKPLISKVLKKKKKKVAFARNKTLKRGGHIRNKF